MNREGKYIYVCLYMHTHTHNVSTSKDSAALSETIAPQQTNNAKENPLEHTSYLSAM